MISYTELDEEWGQARTAQTATLTASSEDRTEIYRISLGAAVHTLTLSATRMSFGMVAVGGMGTGSVTLTSPGTTAVRVIAGSVSGTGYTISGVSFPRPLNQGRTVKLGIAFTPRGGGPREWQGDADEQLVNSP